MQSFIGKHPFRARALRCLVFLLSIGAFACATPPPVKPESHTEKVTREKVLGLEVAEQLDQQLKFKNDSELSVYLRRLAQKLVDATPELKDSGIGILFIDDKNGPWRNLSLPGNRIYLSVGLLKNMRFENEVAALIANELGHTLKEHFLDQIYRRKAQEGQSSEGPSIAGLLPPQPGSIPKSINFFGPNGAFAFDEEELLGAAESGVELMYRAGYDPRGLASVWMKYYRHLKLSPYDEVTISKLLERTRSAISKYPPLRNPIVKSSEFEKMRKRIQAL